MLLAFATLERAFLATTMAVTAVLAVLCSLVADMPHRQVRVVGGVCGGRSLRIDERRAGAALFGVHVVVLAALFAGHGGSGLAQWVARGVSVHGGSPR